MDYQIKQLNIEDFEKFYTFAHDFILEQFLDYPPIVREKWWKIEFEKKKLLRSIKKGDTIILFAHDNDEIIGFALLILEDIPFRILSAASFSVAPLLRIIGSLLASFFGSFV